VGAFGRCLGVAEVGSAPEECVLLCDSGSGEVFPSDGIAGMLVRLFARLRGFLNSATPPVLSSYFEGKMPPRLICFWGENWHRVELVRRLGRLDLEWEKRMRFFTFFSCPDVVVNGRGLWIGEMGRDLGCAKFCWSLHDGTAKGQLFLHIMQVQALMTQQRLINV
jgi:hypothetical protein